MQDIMDGSRILIFSETKRGCDNLTRQLRQDGWPALAIHGDKSQQERDWVLKDFKEGKSPLMIATDVASRGIDVKGEEKGGRRSVMYVCVCVCGAMCYLILTLHISSPRLPCHLSSKTSAT
jgi:hypothetical protein